MDQLFIDHPDMHKFFYKDSNNCYAKITPDMKEYELVLCIAEKFKDVFQYTFPLEKYLNRRDRVSYAKYKEMIMDSPALHISKYDLSWSNVWKNN